MGRAPCCDKASVKRGPWSPDEDAILKAYIDKHGTGGNWIALPHKIGLKRCGKSCRLRWLNYLRPNIKHGGFTEEEEYLICSLYISIGSRWSIIASQLPGRTDNDIKNYWNTRLKKKLFGEHQREQEKGRPETAFSLYNQLPQPANSSHIANIPATPPPEAFPGNLYCNSGVSQSQHLGGEYPVIGPPLESNCFQPFDHHQIPYGIMYGAPHQLDEMLDSFSAVDVNRGTVSAESAMSCGGMSDVAVYTAVLSSYDVCQKKLFHDCSFFDQSRLLGYSE